jgi:nicotinate-nucleotide adenylyltransferase
MGGDNLSQFHLWRRWREIASMVPIAVVSRPGGHPKAGLSRFARSQYGARLPEEAAQSLKDRKPPAWVYLSAPLDPTSSTELRAAMIASALPPV